MAYFLSKIKKLLLIIRFLEIRKMDIGLNLQIFSLMDKGKNHLPFDFIFRREM
jgi:hypothetical protein